MDQMRRPSKRTSSAATSGERKRKASSSTSIAPAADPGLSAASPLMRTSRCGPGSFSPRSLRVNLGPGHRSRAPPLGWLGAVHRDVRVGGPMARRVFFHIGAPKSGTTFLQTVMWENRARLEGQGLLYPGSRRFDQYLLYDHIRRPARGNPRAAETW